MRKHNRNQFWTRDLDKRMRQQTYQDLEIKTKTKIVL